MNITRRIVFHAGHMLKDDDSKCYHPHGHEYVLECTLTGEVKTEGVENGMVMNFGNLKEIMMKQIHDLVDHKFIVQFSDPRFEKFVDAVGESGIHIVRFAPTAENLVKYFYDILEGLFRHHKVRISLRLQETYQCWVEYAGS